jgi:hypothetical protein
MPLNSEQVRAEVLSWVDAQLKEKRFGSFGIEIRMHEGVPVSVEKRDCVSIKYHEG